MAKFATNASSAIWWLNFQLMQVATFGPDRNTFDVILVEKISQVLDLIPWVRCASGFILFLVKLFAAPTVRWPFENAS